MLASGMPATVAAECPVTRWRGLAPSTPTMPTAAPDEKTSVSGPAKDRFAPETPSMRWTIRPSEASHTVSAALPPNGLSEAA